MRTVVFKLDSMEPQGSRKLPWLGAGREEKRAEADGRTHSWECNSSWLFVIC